MPAVSGAVKIRNRWKILYRRSETGLLSELDEVPSVGQLAIPLLAMATTAPVAPALLFIIFPPTGTVVTPSMLSFSPVCQPPERRMPFISLGPLGRGPASWPITPCLCLFQPAPGLSLVPFLQESKLQGALRGSCFPRPWHMQLAHVLSANIATQIICQQANPPHRSPRGCTVSKNPQQPATSRWKCRGKENAQSVSPTPKCLPSQIPLLCCVSWTRSPCVTLQRRLFGSPYQVAVVTGTSCLDHNKDEHFPGQGDSLRGPGLLALPCHSASWWDHWKCASWVCMTYHTLHLQSLWSFPGMKLGLLSLSKEHRRYFKLLLGVSLFGPVSQVPADAKKKTTPTFTLVKTVNRN